MHGCLTTSVYGTWIAVVEGGKCITLVYNSFFPPDFINYIAIYNGSSSWFDVNSAPGPCENQQYLCSYELTQRPSPNPPKTFVDGDFSPPFCLAFTVTLPTDTPGFLFVAQDLPYYSNEQDSIVSSMLISSREIKFILEGKSVTFPPPNGAGSFVTSGSEFVHLQLCVSTEGQARLYTNCDDSSAPQTLVLNQCIRYEKITFFQNPTVDGRVPFEVISLPPCMHAGNAIKKSMPFNKP